MSSKRPVPDDFDGADGSTTPTASNHALTLMSSPSNEPSLWGETCYQKRPRLSRIREKEQDTPMFGTFYVVALYYFSTLPLREDEASPPIPNQSVIDGRDLPATTGPCLFQGASHISTNHSFFSAVGRDQHISITPETDGKLFILKFLSLVFMRSRTSSNCCVAVSSQLQVDSRGDLPNSGRRDWPMAA